MREKLQAQLNHYLAGPPCHFVVAYSGGVDSHALLHAMVQLSATYPVHHLSAVHVNHGISQNSNTWQAHCETVCASYGVLLQCVSLSLKKEKQVSLEAKAREARYTSFATHLPDNAVILLGQHQQDQSETLILQLMRGAGPKGLSSMPFDIAHKANLSQRLVRPLLTTSRTDIEIYAKASGLQWVEDESNQDSQFSRNYLRNQVFPLLRQKWPQLDASLARSALLCQEQQSLLDEVTAEKLRDILVEEGHSQGLSVKALLAHSEAWQKNLVRFWLSQQGIVMPSLAILSKLSAEVLLAKEDADPILQWQEWQFRRFQGTLFVIRHQTFSKQHQSFQLEHGQHYDLPFHRQVRLVEKPQVAASSDAWLCYLNESQVSIAFAGFSKKFTPQGSGFSKPLKQWFQVWGVPPWQRNMVAQILVGGEVAGVMLENKLVISARHAELEPSGILNTLIISKP